MQKAFADIKQVSACSIQLGVCKGSLVGGDATCFVWRTVHSNC